MSERERSIERVEGYLREHGLEIDLLQLDKSTRTAQLAAQAIGAELGSIVKSLVFLADGEPVLVLVAGDRRADTRRLRALLAARRVMIADADQVREATGFTIGGVPPVAHDHPLRTLVDRNLSRFDTVYAAAGTPQAVFPITYRQLIALTGGQEVDCTE